MRPEKAENPLDYLPEAMVDEMLKKHSQVVENLGQQLRKVGALKKSIREQLEQLGLIRNVHDILGQRGYTTTAGVDGSYVAIKQLSLDTVAIAAVAVEGLVPPRETGFWEKPQHVVNIFPVSHHVDTIKLCRGIMFSYELRLAHRAPHRVVFLDGSLTSQLIGVGQSLSAIAEGKKRGDPVPPELEAQIQDSLENTMIDYRDILRSPKVHQLFVGVPKYSSKSEVIHKLQESGLNDPIFTKLNDKGLLSTVLKAGEVVGPVPLENPGGKWHISDVPEKYWHLRDDIVSAMNDLHVLYFKPSPGHPALRLEISKDAALNERRLSLLLEALLDQGSISGVIEPYPIHIADLFVKQVHGALGELRNAALTDLGEILEMNFSDVFLSLHDYRSEGGFD